MVLLLEKVLPRYAVHKIRNFESYVRSGVRLEDIAGSGSGLARGMDQAMLSDLASEAFRRWGDSAQRKGGKAWERFETFRLRYSEDLSWEEIARRKGLDSRTLQNMCERGRQHFKRALREFLASLHSDSPEAADRLYREILDFFNRY
jgi:hypothetical protein